MEKPGLSSGFSFKTLNPIAGLPDFIGKQLRITGNTSVSNRFLQVEPISRKVTEQQVTTIFHLSFQVNYFCNFNIQSNLMFYISRKYVLSFNILSLNKYIQCNNFEIIPENAENFTNLHRMGFKRAFCKI